MAVPPECYIFFKTKTASFKMNLVYMFMPRMGETYEPRHAIMCLREINYVMRYDVVKSDVIISRRA